MADWLAPDLFVSQVLENDCESCFSLLAAWLRVWFWICWWIKMRLIEVFCRECLADVSCCFYLWCLSLFVLFLYLCLKAVPSNLGGLGSVFCVFPLRGVLSPFVCKFFSCVIKIFTRCRPHLLKKKPKP